MLATKKAPVRTFLALVMPGLVILLTACTPPGPRALLEGDRLLREGKYQKAIQKLESARRYMERDPRVWNWLGLAYQGAGNADLAVAAYRQALELDRSSNMVFAAHYNLGNLYLEQGNAAAAVGELTSFCLLSNSLPALLKLGQAELRSRQVDAAGRTFERALRSWANEPAALNGLGLVYAQRNRPRDAAQCFQNALRQKATYAPALLNLAVLYHQQPGQKAYAVQKYREYLALEPHAANEEAVKAALRDLEQELAPVHPPATNHLVVVPPRTNPIVTLTNPVTVAANTQRAVITPAAPTQKVSQVTTSQIVKPVASVPPAHPNVPTPTTQHETNLSAPVVRTAVPASTAARSVPSSPGTPTNPGTRATVAAPLPTGAVEVPAVTVVELSEAPPPKAAQDVAPPFSPPISGPPATPSTGPGSGSMATTSPRKQEKRSLLQKLNPFAKKPKSGAASTGSAPKPGPAPKVTTSPAGIPATVPQEMAATDPAVSQAVPESPRYVYLAPAKPKAGNRADAKPLFEAGLTAQEGRHNEEALKSYRLALEKDPAYYEAWYNLSLAASQVGDLKATLQACEAALAIDPERAEARVHLGLVLEQAGYPLDAANELETAVKAKPDEVRAHLTLANLYAQKLHRSVQARAHYLRVLEIQPHHPRANEIRYWLAANP